MVKKKVTLSLDVNTYNSFKKYCEDNAIMLSKRVELEMRRILKGAKS